MEWSLFDLEKMLDSGELTSYDLVQFYLKRIAMYDKSGLSLNSIGEINPDVEIQALLMEVHAAIIYVTSYRIVLALRRAFVSLSLFALRHIGHIRCVSHSLVPRPLRFLLAHQQDIGQQIGAQQGAEPLPEYDSRREQNPLRILDCKVDKEKEIMQNIPKMQDYLNEESNAYFQQVLQGLEELGIPYEVDERLVRGLDYYTHTVFEVVSVNKEMGSQSTVFAGGRYDGLIEYFGGPSISGIGWAMGLERLILACEAEGIELGEEPALDAYVLCLSPQAALMSLRVTTQLRAAGYRSDMDYLNRSFKAQFKTVDRRHAKIAVLIGETEMEQGTVNIKEIATQVQQTVAMDDLIDVVDHIFEAEEESTGHCACHAHEEEE